MPTQPPEFKFTWDDLIVSNVTPDEAAAWLSSWQWLGLGRIAPIFLSRFGNWFFHRTDGSIHMLEVTEADVKQVAPNFAAFQAAVNTQEFQEQYLYSALAMRFRRQGVIATGRQAIGFAPHPALADSLDNCRPMVLDMQVWQTICGQTMQQVRGTGA